MGQVNICEIYTLLAPQWQNIKHLPIRFGLDLFFHVHEKQEENKVWDMWLMQYQNMDKDTFVSFDDFYSNIKKPKVISQRSAEDILAEAQEIRKQLGR